MKSRLISIEENNKRIKEKLRILKEYGTPSGVACPKCKNELYVKRDSIKTTYPPQADTTCPNCNYKTTILV